MDHVDVQLLLSKLRSKEDSINFMRETGKNFILILGFYLPNDRGFDGKFFVQVLKGEKTVCFLYNILQLLHIGEIGGVEFPWFTKTNHFTKNHLLSIFINEPTLRAYLPDDIKLTCLSRDFLITVKHN